MPSALNGAEKDVVFSLMGGNDEYGR